MQGMCCVPTRPCRKGVHGKARVYWDRRPSPSFHPVWMVPARRLVHQTGAVCSAPRRHRSCALLLFRFSCLVAVSLAVASFSAPCARCCCVCARFASCRFFCRLFSFLLFVPLLLVFVFVFFVSLCVFVCVSLCVCTCACLDLGTF